MHKVVILRPPPPIYHSHLLQRLFPDDTTPCCQTAARKDPAVPLTAVLFAPRPTKHLPCGVEAALPYMVPDMGPEL